MARMPRELDAAQSPAGHAGYVRYRNAHDVCARATLSPLLARSAAAAPPRRRMEVSEVALNGAKRFAGITILKGFTANISIVAAL